MQKINKNILEDLTKIDGGTQSTARINSSYKYCQELAKSNYENFPVGSILVPKSNRKYFYSVYAFARIGDDIGDEYDFSTEQRLSMLEGMAASLNVYVNSKPEEGNPIFLALSDTLEKKNINTNVPLRLLEAFKRDILFEQPKKIEDLLEYCAYSANPIGELVLGISDEYINNDELLSYSNSFCSGLQLLNFWQDLSRDMSIGRMYIPTNILEQFSISIVNNNGRYRWSEEKNAAKLMDYLLTYTEEKLTFGSQISEVVSSHRLKYELRLMKATSSLVLKKCRNLGKDLIWKRPIVKKSSYFSMIPKIFFGR
ncbi:MAG: squalene synthase HpnC [Candidatus Kapaibacteriales bacterium]